MDYKYNNFNDIDIIKTLGVGKFGTTYLAKYNNDNYALKIQHILPSDRNKSYKTGLWRELDLYDYINSLQPKQQIFFTKLYGYEIIDNCTHKQNRPFKIDINNKKDKFAIEALELDKSNWCVKLLTEYKGKRTLQQYLYNNRLTVPQTYSIILQLCNIMLILYEGGYSHNDLNTTNIMLNFTEEKTFKFLNKRIPFNGLQISVIDYGKVLHKKFEMNFLKKFLEDRKSFFFEELYSTMYYIITNYDKYVNDCIKMNQDLPWVKDFYYFENGIKKIINEQHDFFTETKNKYVKIYPKSTVLINTVEENINKSTIKKIIKNQNDKTYFWKVIDRIVYELRLLHPKLHSEYFKWCSYHKCNLPKQDILDIMLLTNVDELFNYLINKIS
jgi:serine/threonine protein kinase